MNDGTLSKGRRGYSSSLREQQAEQTRDRILSAVAGLMRGGEMEELSYNLVAERAGVSVPTIYRYFPSRKALFEGLDRWLARELRRPEFPSSLPALLESAPALFRYYHDSRDLLSAARVSAILREANREGRKHRDRGLADMLAPLTAGLPPARANAVHALFRLLFGYDGYEMMHERFGVGPEEAADTIIWAASTLAAALERAPGGPGKAADGSDGKPEESGPRAGARNGEQTKATQRRIRK